MTQSPTLHDDTDACLGERSDTGSKPSSYLMRTRRAWLGTMAAALLASCTSPNPRFNGTFIQPWKSYETLSRDEWRRRLRLTRALGCEEIVLQWTAIYGGSNAWELPTALLDMIISEASESGMGVRMGLPYNEGWWNAMASADPQVLAAFLIESQNRCIHAMQTTPWARSPTFRGWYLPYELDQYNWATPARRSLLLPWLQAIASASRQQTPQPLAISTFFSQLQTAGSLKVLWSEILDAVQLRPMLQDGVGVAGMGNHAGLVPLGKLLRERGVAFDLIVELFEQLPPLEGTNGAFRARAATVARLRAQMALARTYGAEHVIAYAIDPWMLGETPEAQQLLKDWQPFP